VLTRRLRVGARELRPAPLALEKLDGFTEKLARAACLPPIPVDE
jgi:hypothetical protein